MKKERPRPLGRSGPWRRDVDVDAGICCGDVLTDRGLVNGSKDMKVRPLGSSGIEVSRLSLGSWRTFERIPRVDGIAVMEKARESGINFLDDARYNDETGKAPLKTGYSEVVFGELFRAAG